MVEQPAVNRWVLGSNPSCGASHKGRPLGWPLVFPVAPGAAGSAARWRSLEAEFVAKFVDVEPPCGGLSRLAQLEVVEERHERSTQAGAS